MIRPAVNGQRPV